MTQDSDMSKNQDQRIEGWRSEINQHAENTRAWIKAALVELTRGRDDVVAVGLFTDSDGITLVPTALSREHRDACAADDPELAVFYAWCPDEWDIQLDGGETSPLDALQPYIQALADKVDDDHWLDFTTLMYNWYVEQMVELRDFFDDTYPGANVAFWVTDNDEPTENIVEWVEKLNPPERAEPYIDWLRSQD